MAAKPTWFSRLFSWVKGRAAPEAGQPPAWAAGEVILEGNEIEATTKVEDRRSLPR